MLKTLKWVYDLGVKQERNRIARYLEGQAAALSNEFAVEYDMLETMTNNTKQRKARLELKHSVTRQVSDIVRNILAPNYQDRDMFSLMFPDDKHKEK